MAITLPAELNDAQPTVNPNWTVEKVTEQLAEPKKLADGTSITKRTSQIVYTAKAPLDHDLRDALVLSVKLPDAAGTTLHFPTLQSCETGQTDWSEIAKDGQDPHSLKAPAPSITITAAADAHGAASHAATTVAAEHRAGSRRSRQRRRRPQLGRSGGRHRRTGPRRCGVRPERRQAQAGGRPVTLQHRRFDARIITIRASNRPSGHVASLTHATACRNGYAMRSQRISHGLLITTAASAVALLLTACGPSQPQPQGTTDAAHRLGQPLPPPRRPPARPSRRRRLRAQQPPGRHSARLPPCPPPLTPPVAGPPAAST